MHINGHEKFLMDSANNVAVQYFLSKQVPEPGFEPAQCDLSVFFKILLLVRELHTVHLRRVQYEAV